MTETEVTEVARISRISETCEYCDYTKKYGICDEILIFLSWVLIILLFPFSLLFIVKIVREYERVVVFRLGRILGENAKGPGLYITIPCTDCSVQLDIRLVSYYLPPQEILSKDSVSLSVDALILYRVNNAAIAVISIEDYSKSTRLLAAATLRNVLSTKSLSEILSNRDEINNKIKLVLDEATDKWGVQIQRVEIKDIKLPKEIQKAINSEAEAVRQAKAQLIYAEGEKKASNLLKQAAHELESSPISLHLRYLQTISNIGSHNSTIIFPLPIEFFKNFLKS